MEMLGRYYTDKDVYLTREEFIRRFGPARTRAIMGDQPSVRVTPDLLERLWDTPDEQGCCIGILTKTIRTKPGG
jgi:hypothetical protein